MSETAEAKANTVPHRITICRLREWRACSDGREWFRAKFPDGAAYGEVIAALLGDKRRADAAWLSARVIDAWGTDAGFIAQAVADEIRITTARAGAVDDGSDSTVATSGYGSRVATSGSYSTVATSGYGSRVATSGYGSRVATSGSYSTVATSGSDSTVATSGSDSTVATSGYGSRVATSGYGSRLNLGPNSSGCAAWHDGNRPRFAACTTADGDLSLGEQRVKVGVTYRLDAAGLFVECGA